MKKLVIQFHAAGHELSEYAEAMRAELPVFVTVMTNRPFSVKLAEEEITARDLEHQEDQRLIFSLERPDLGVSSPNEFFDRNPGCIVLNMGKLTTKGLKESSLLFMSDDPKRIEVASTLFSRLKRITRAGAVAVNSATLAEARVSAHRHTQGARALHQAGTKMLPLAGNSFFVLPS